ncbi:MAG TPA: L-histidine N(alpha)-methyltransferase, partial [bacterium]|nr:L-histidine N(alpha)-methyltransferase [bacterium]
MTTPEPHVDLAPDVDEFRRDILNGLRADRKTIPCKYLYDEEGSRLFEEITRLPEYYPTRTEIGILRARAPEMARMAGERCLLIELGSGNSRKTEILLERLEDPAGYVPIDISREHLLESAERLRENHPEVEVLPVCADFTADLTLPQPSKEAHRRVFFFPGSTIGNFSMEEASAFLERVARMVRSGGVLIIGVDLRKDRETLEAAYDDAAGVTAAFNRNLLARANRELDADFRPETFQHRAAWEPDEGRVEMHLVSTEDQAVRVGGETFRFRKGESIWTE